MCVAPRCAAAREYTAAAHKEAWDMVVKSSGGLRSPLADFGGLWGTAGGLLADTGGLLADWRTSGGLWRTGGSATQLAVLLCHPTRGSEQFSQSVSSVSFLATPGEGHNSQSVQFSFLATPGE
eukprot:gene17963-biopygen6835